MMWGPHCNDDDNGSNMIPKVHYRTTGGSNSIKQINVTIQIAVTLDFLDANNLMFTAKVIYIISN